MLRKRGVCVCVFLSCDVSKGNTERKKQFSKTNCFMQLKRRAFYYSMSTACGLLQKTENILIFSVFPVFSL